MLLCGFDWLASNRFSSSNWIVMDMWQSVRSKQRMKTSVLLWNESIKHVCLLWWEPSSSFPSGVGSSSLLSSSSFTYNSFELLAMSRVSWIYLIWRCIAQQCHSIFIDHIFEIDRQRFDAVSWTLGLPISYSQIFEFTDDDISTFFSRTFRHDIFHEYSFSNISLKFSVFEGSVLGSSILLYWIQDLRCRLDSVEHQS